jgi:hypothetical protein
MVAQPFAWGALARGRWGVLARGTIFLVTVGLAWLVTGCTPSVGDACVLSTDCGSTGTLVCDTSQYAGYCTQLNCMGNFCPNNAACILFNPGEPGCAYNDRVGPSRDAVAFCMATCASNADCRVGYICVLPTEAPWNAANLDNNPNEHVCIALPTNNMVGGDSAPPHKPDAAVCQSVGPMFDAFPPISDAMSDVLSETSDGTSPDATSDASHHD